MIPTLLWQCPLCRVDDALTHRAHWWRNDEVECASCGAAFGVQRVIGNDYLLTVVRGDPSTIGQQRPLVEWYDLMKAGLTLRAREAPSVARPAGEEVYVQSGKALLFVESDSPLFGPWGREEAPWQQEGHRRVHDITKWDDGRLSLTSERFIWTGTRGALSFRLRGLTSVYTEDVLLFGFRYGFRSYKVRFPDESVLKWLTYAALATRRLEPPHHRITMTNY